MRRVWWFRKITTRVRVNPKTSHVLKSTSNIFSNVNEVLPSTRRQLCAWPAYSIQNGTIRFYRALKYSFCAVLYAATFLYTELVNLFGGTRQIFANIILVFRKHLKKPRITQWAVRWIFIPKWWEIQRSTALAGASKWLVISHSAWIRIVLLLLGSASVTEPSLTVISVCSEICFHFASSWLLWSRSISTLYLLKSVVSSSVPSSLKSWLSV